MKTLKGTNAGLSVLYLVVERAVPLPDQGKVPTFRAAIAMSDLFEAALTGGHEDAHPAVKGKAEGEAGEPWSISYEGDFELKVEDAHFEVLQKMWESAGNVRGAWRTDKKKRRALLDADNIVTTAG